MKRVYRKIEKGESLAGELCLTRVLHIAAKSAEKEETIFFHNVSKLSGIHLYGNICV